MLFLSASLFCINRKLLLFSALLLELLRQLILLANCFRTHHFDVPGVCIFFRCIQESEHVKHSSSRHCEKLEHTPQQLSLPLCQFAAAHFFLVTKCLRLSLLCLLREAHTPLEITI